MAKKWFNRLLFCAAVTAEGPAFCQLQTCPVNINFSSGDLSHWSAQTGLVGGNTVSYPAPNTGIASIPEYTIGITGIKVITSSTTDLYGGFRTIPVINGYAYNYSIQLGSTAISHDLNSNSRNPGGFTRSVTYTINVPAGSTAVPYTMTYAYAMVLENGTHNSNQQPLFKAILSTNDSVITCASPYYYLPTFNDAGGNGNGSIGATLDSAAAIANGFTNSPVLFLSYTGNNGSAVWLQDVWTKDWTEVTFDLSPYRGQQVTLTFEADNCTPGGHFAYAYVALRNTCAGLEISGNPRACTNSPLDYSIPALANATYNWTVPGGWTINSGANSHIINVTPGNTGGIITVQQVNSCANLKDTITVVTTPPTVAGRVTSDHTVCAGTNSTPLTLSGNAGSVLGWVSSTDGTSWTKLPVTTGNYTAQDLTTTTRYAALVQNGSACRIDTSAMAIVSVDPKTVAGILNPADSTICTGQHVTPTLFLTGYTGAVVNWQRSDDNLSWNNFNPVYNATNYTTGPVTATTYYRTIVKSGVCPADTSSRAAIRFNNVAYPDATIHPDSSFICYGKSAVLNATINTGTSYAWINLPAVTSGTVNTIPANISKTVTPPATTNYILNVYNAGCPNTFADTFHVHVHPPIKVNAGRDTNVVINQPLQLYATVNDPLANIWNWSPPTGLADTKIPNPVATYGSSTGATVTYIVTAITSEGCIGVDNITVRIFKTPADIFMPNAFTPNGDTKNDVIMPVCAGIQKLVFFRIYNRWGQLVFSTSEIGKGWDGRLGGVLLTSDNFVYMIQAIDYTGKVINKKGNVVLIR